MPHQALILLLYFEHCEPAAPAARRGDGERHTQRLLQPCAPPVSVISPDLQSVPTAHHLLAAPVAHRELNYLEVGGDGDAPRVKARHQLAIHEEFSLLQIMGLSREAEGRFDRLLDGE